MLGRRGYERVDGRRITVTVSTVLFSIQNGTLYVLLSDRISSPFRGAWVLPTCRLQRQEAIEAAALRTFEGVRPTTVFFEQLRAYGDIDRDPRGRNVTIAYWAACSGMDHKKGASNTPITERIPLTSVINGSHHIAFDHQRIVKDANERLKARLETTSIGSRFCGQQFTISDLRKVYDTVWNTRLDPGNFQRKVRINSVFREMGTMSFGVVEEQKESMGRMDDSALSETITAPSAPPRTDQTSPKPLEERRWGRPPSIWTASQTEFKLNQPIFRSGTLGRR